MSSIYDRTDIYDLLEDQTHWSAYKKHWKTLLQGKNVHSFLDVSIGSGSVTLPLCELGVQLAGSDLSEEMIRKNFKMPEFELVDWYCIMAKKND